MEVAPQAADIDTRTPRAETEIPKEPSSPVSAPMSLSVFQEIHKMRQQNGLRHSDYRRYRCFCARRLKRLRTGLRFKNGKSRYQSRPFPEGSAFNDARYLLIPLVTAERAWSYGIQIKDDNASAAHASHSSRYRSVRRLRKGALHAGQLVTLCQKYADKKSVLEAKAYHMSLKGQYEMERGLLAEAHTTLSSHVALLRQLTLLSSTNVEEQTVFKYHISSTESLLRLCAYRISLKGSTADPDGPTAIAEGPVSASTGVGDGGATVEGETKIRWRGDVIGVPTRVQKEVVGCHHALKTCCLPPDRIVVPSDDASGVGEGSPKEDIDKYGEVSSLFTDALKAIHSDMLSVDESSMKDSVTWRSVECHTRVTSLIVSGERHLLLALMCLKEQENPFDVFESSKRPEDGIRLADMCTESLQSLVSEIKEFNDGGTASAGSVASQQSIAFLKIVLRVIANARALFMGRALALHGKYEESFALSNMVRSRDIQVPKVSRTEPVAADTLPTLDEYINRLQPVTLELQHSVIQVATAFLPLIMAEVVAKANGPNAAGRTGEQDNIFQFPPRPAPLFCNPIVFDLADMEAGVPDISHRLQKSSGLMNKLTGWWKR